MADGTIVEGIKLLGGVAGLATAAFTIWDRAFREQPQVWVVADPFSGVGQRYLHLVIHNPAHIQIRVTSVSVTPELFEVWKDNSLDASVDADMGVQVTSFIDGKSEKRFPIRVFGDISEENQDVLCKIKVRWRSMRHEHIPSFAATHRKTIRTMRAQESDKA